MSSGDKLLVDLMMEARKNGMRVLLRRPFYGGSEEDPEALALNYGNQPLRWLDPNRDGDSSDGIDGWLLFRPSIYSGNAPAIGFQDRLRTVKKDAIVVALDPYGPPDASNTPSVALDAVLHSHAGDAAVQFFTRKVDGQQFPLDQRRFSLDQLTLRLQSSRIRDLTSYRIVNESLQQVVDPHLILALAKETDWASDADLQLLREQGEFEKLLGRWQLYVTLRFFAPEQPVTHFGDEVGFHFQLPLSRPAMWWNDLENPESKEPNYRGDFYALIQMLNTFRARFAPLRRGDFKPLIADDEKKLLAFARTLPGDEIILVMNYGDAKQSVTLTVGRPGDLVQVLSPQLKPMPMVRKGQPPPPEPDHTKIPELRVGGQREYVKPDGTIDFWVDPMGVRIVVLGESAQTGKK